MDWGLLDASLLPLSSEIIHCGYPIHDSMLPTNGEDNLTFLVYKSLHQEEQHPNLTWNSNLPTMHHEIPEMGWERG
jgi:hypothetical protein